jgi:hypothetical protein
MAATKVTTSTGTGAAKLPPLKQSVHDMVVQWVPRSKLNFWKENPRKNDAAAKELAESIRIQGMQTPIVVWTKDMCVYKGNTTLKALDIINKWRPGAADYNVPCLMRNWASKAEATAYGLADNRLGENSEWDKDKLILLTSSESMKPLLTYTGFKEKDLNALGWMPNLKRMNDIDETDEGMAGIVKVQCKPEDAADIKATLAAWAKDCGYENVRVK